jgi:hypothetical protein
MKFIVDRIRGLTFNEASGYNELNSITEIKENAIHKFKEKVEKLKYM